MAPVSVVTGSPVSCIICCHSCLKYLLLLSVVCSSGICRPSHSCGSSIFHCLWLHYWSFMAPVSSICWRSCICRLWLRQWLHWLSLVAPVSSSVVRPVVVVVVSSSCGSNICWLLMAPVVSLLLSVAPVDRCRLWLRYHLLHDLLSFMAPVSPVVRSWLHAVAHDSSICRVCLQYHHYLLLVAPVAPVSVACDSCCSCGFNRQSSSVLAIFLPNRLLLLYLSKYRQITTTEW